MKEEEEEEEKECVEAINLFDVYIYSSLKHCSFFSFSSLVVIILQWSMNLWSRFHRSVRYAGRGLLPEKNGDPPWELELNLGILNMKLIKLIHFPFSFFFSCW
jgi:hypothetical protein